jgi:hypothetical protein
MDEECRKDMPPAAITAGFPVSTSGAEARMLQQSQ